MSRGIRTCQSRKIRVVAAQHQDWIILWDGVAFCRRVPGTPDSPVPMLRDFETTVAALFCKWGFYRVVDNDGELYPEMRFDQMPILEMRTQPDGTSVFMVKRLTNMPILTRNGVQVSSAAQRTRQKE